jgi:hypothetical protein
VFSVFFSCAAFNCRDFDQLLEMTLFSQNAHLLDLQLKICTKSCIKAGEVSNIWQTWLSSIRKRKQSNLKEMNRLYP